MFFSLIFLPLPFSILQIQTNDSYLLSLKKSNKKFIQQKGDRLSIRVAKQVQEYAEGKRKAFDIPLQMHGTPFQLSVWNALLKIPYGETRTYAQVAKMINKPKAARAVGNALNKNPICIIVPCHRVTASNGLGGYAYGIAMKKQLLALEQQHKRTY